MRRVIVMSSALAASSTLFTFPFFHYLIFVVPYTCLLTETRYHWDFLFAQLFLLFFICLLSAIVGFSFSKRFKLPGFGNPRDFINAIPHLLTLASIMIIISYFFFDRYFYEISPSSYPKGFIYLISLPFKGAFTDEIILRFCLVTLSVGLFKHKGAGVIFVSVLASLFTIKYLNFIGIRLYLSYLFLIQLFLSFVCNLVLGYLFVTRGLLYSMTLNFLFSMKYFVIYWAKGA